MTRSNYSDDCDGWDLIRWRGAVEAAIRGKRGQKLLREMLAALDAMPTKSLIANYLERNGEHCALGVVGAARGIPMAEIDPDDPIEVAQAFDIAYALAKEIAFVNDDSWPYVTSEQRWLYVRAWAAEQIRPEAT